MALLLPARPRDADPDHTEERMVDSDGRPTHAEGEPPSGCEVCGRDVDDPSAVMTWTLDVHDDDRWEWVCPDCSREHLRDIEARLDLDGV